MESTFQASILSITVKNTNYFGWSYLCKWVHSNSPNILLCISPNYVCYRCIDKYPKQPPTQTPQSFFSEKQQLLCKLQRDQTQDITLGQFKTSLLQVQLTTNPQNIFQLKLSNKGDGWNQQQMPFRLPLQVLTWVGEKFTRLKSLEIVDGAVTKQMLKELKVLKDLREVSLRNNRITAEEIRGMMCGMRGLEVVNLVGNTIGTEGVEMIIRVLPNLRELHVDSDLPLYCCIRLAIKLKRLTSIYFKPCQNTRKDQIILQKFNPIFSRLVSWRTSKFQIKVVILD